MSRLFERALDGGLPSFVLLHRPDGRGGGVLEVLAGELSTPDTIAEVPLPEEDGGARHEVFVMIPFRQIAERGYACADDGSPLLAISITEQDELPVGEALSRLPNQRITLTETGFDVDDETYARTVRQVVADEIGTGEGANFVIMRSFTGRITDYSPGSALSFFRRLLEGESGAYWTYLVHTGNRTFVGATPERHISYDGLTAVMNPISGTYRYPSAGPTLPEVLEFLADRKETDELYMVVDEELKMMARICDDGGQVVGPYLKEMTRLAHTEYLIEGRTTRDPREILHQTMFAPTVTGSPLENACTVLGRYERRGRGYYSGIAALIGRDATGRRVMDSSIVIRTADISASGNVRIGVGATLVRHSDPESEVAETRAKASALLAALGIGGTRVRLGAHPSVRAALDRRNDLISGFWLGSARERETAASAVLAGRRVLIIDAEDTFTSMIGHQLRALGLEVTVRRFDEPYELDNHELVVLGPGPGDPRAGEHPKIAHLEAAVEGLLDHRRPFLAVCLSHQVLSRRLGFELVRRTQPNQGVQREIDLFGRPERVGFYNTFAARATSDTAEVPGVGRVTVSRDPATGEVHALHGPHFASAQFHAESVLTQNGVRIVEAWLTTLLAQTRTPIAG